MLHIITCTAIGTFVGMAGTIPFSLYGDDPNKHPLVFLIIVAIYTLVGLITGFVTLN